MAAHRSISAARWRSQINVAMRLKDLFHSCQPDLVISYEQHNVVFDELFFIFMSGLSSSVLRHKKKFHVRNQYRVMEFCSSEGGGNDIRKIIF